MVHSQQLQHSQHRILRMVGAIVVALSIVMGTAGLADAMSPPQKSARGVVVLLGGRADGSIDDFWRFAFRSWGEDYRSPKLYFYGKGVWMGRMCGVQAERLLKNAIYCPSDHSIYMDKNWVERLVDRTGDYHAGGILAHEWGHAISNLLGNRVSGFREEYHADCLAGMYTKYGYEAGRLTGGDYDELRNWYLTLGYSKSHGYGESRAEWFDYGYSEYSLEACDKAFELTGP